MGEGKRQDKGSLGWGGNALGCVSGKSFVNLYRRVVERYKEKGGDDAQHEPEGWTDTDGMEWNDE